MPLSAGDKLGPYEIIAPIGAGGMGEVFRAQDTRLGRTVAVKVLPQHAVADAAQKRRFLQEARAASALNHPNIAALHDIANEGGVDNLVMEYVPGRPLAELITAGGLPVVEAIRYCEQLAGALAAAHAAGVVHRDIKPANVLVTPDLQTKVLDFGLAKLLEPVSSPEAQTRTMEAALTEAGTVLGTVAYMSPEQASGQPLDHRTDIFSLGVVLYELLCGLRPFRGSSQVETMHAIIREPMPRLEGQPEELNEVLAKALEKAPKDRYQHVGDLALDLRRFLRAWESKSLPSMRRDGRTTPQRQVGLAVLVGVLAAALPIAWWVGRSSRQAAPENPLAGAQFTPLTDFRGAKWDVAISPDGKFVAFGGDRDGEIGIWVSQLGSGRFQNLMPGKGNDLRTTVRSIGFTGDGSEIWVCGARSRRLQLIPLFGGTPRVFLPDRTINVAWSPDGSRIVYHTDRDGDPIFVADRTGAGARQIFVDKPGVHNHYPVWSTDSRWIYFARGIQATAESDLWRIPAGGGQAERLTKHNSYVAYPTPIDERTVLYVGLDHDGAGPWLWALNVERKVTSRVSFGLEQYTSIAASTGGRIVASVAKPIASLWSVPILDSPAEEREVKAHPLPTVRALAPRFGAGSLFYLSSRGAGEGLWRYEGGQAVEIWKGTDGALREPAAVSANGNRVAFVLRQKGRRGLHVATRDGTDLAALAESIDVQGAPGWSPDGNWVVTGGVDADGPGLFKIPASGGAPVRLVAGAALDPVWSPDGALIVYVDVNVSTFVPLKAVRPDGTPVELPAIKVRTLGERARFLPDGKGLVYMQGENPSQDFWLLDLATKRSRPLTKLDSFAAMRTFDISPDGSRIVFDRVREETDIVLIDVSDKER